MNKIPRGRVRTRTGPVTERIGLGGIRRAQPKPSAPSKAPSGGGAGQRLPPSYEKAIERGDITKEEAEFVVRGGVGERPPTISAPGKPTSRQALAEAVSRKELTEVEAEKRLALEGARLEVRSGRPFAERRAEAMAVRLAPPREVFTRPISQRELTESKPVVAPIGLTREELFTIPGEEKKIYGAIYDPKTFEIIGEKPEPFKGLVVEKGRTPTGRLVEKAKITKFKAERKVKEVLPPLDLGKAVGESFKAQEELLPRFMRTPTRLKPVVEFEAGAVQDIYTGVREQPVKTAVVGGAFVVIPPAFAGARFLAGTKFVSPLLKPKPIQVIGKGIGLGLRYGLPATYVGFKGVEIYKEPTAFGKGEVFGRAISTEVAPALVGLKVGGKVALPIEQRITVREFTKGLAPQEAFRFKAGIEFYRKAGALQPDVNKIIFGKRFPKKAIPGTKKILREEKVLVFGSAAQKAQLVGGRLPKDIDILAKDYLKVVGRIGGEIRRAGYKPTLKGEKIFLRGKKIVEVHPPEKFGQFLFKGKPIKTPEGIPVIPLREQLARKEFGGLTAGRPKDIPDVLAIQRQFIKEARISGKKRKALKLEELHKKFIFGLDYKAPTRQAFAIPTFMNKRAQLRLGIVEEPIAPLRLGRAKVKPTYEYYKFPKRRPTSVYPTYNFPKAPKGYQIYTPTKKFPSPYVSYKAPKKAPLPYLPYKLPKKKPTPYVPYKEPKPVTTIYPRYEPYKPRGPPPPPPRITTPYDDYVPRKTITGKEFVKFDIGLRFKELKPTLQIGKFKPEFFPSVVGLYQKYYVPKVPKGPFTGFGVRPGVKRLRKKKKRKRR